MKTAANADLSKNPHTANRVPKVDFMAQLREVWGDRMFTDEEVQAMRAAELAAEEESCSS